MFFFSCFQVECQNICVFQGTVRRSWSLRLEQQRFTWSCRVQVSPHFELLLQACFTCFCPAPPTVRLRTLHCLTVTQCQSTYHLHLLHPQLFTTLDRHSLLLSVLQGVVPHRGAEADHDIHPENDRKSGITQQSDSVRTAQDDTALWVLSGFCVWNQSQEQKQCSGQSEASGLQKRKRKAEWSRWSFVSE